MNMYDIMQKLLSSQSLDEQHRPSLIFDNDIRKRQRRRSSITEYELNYVKDKPLTKSTTMMNRFSMLKPRSSTTDHVSLSKKPVRLERQSTIRRLNSFPDDDSNINQIQSNEYTSITDS
jgi:hypothetical protein